MTLGGGSVTTSSDGSVGLAAYGAGSKVTATDVAVTTNGGFDADSGNFAFGVVAASGGNATVSGGSITTNGPVAHAVLAGDGGTIALSNGTKILTTGDGSAGLFVNGATASLMATDVSVTTHGARGPTFNFPAIGAYNGFASPGAAAGGTMKLTDTTILTTGSDAYGIETNSGGVTTVSGGSVTTSGLHAIGVLTQGSGTSASLTGTNGVHLQQCLDGRGAEWNRIVGHAFRRHDHGDGCAGHGDWVQHAGLLQWHKRDRDCHWRRHGDDHQFRNLDKRRGFKRNRDA